MGVASERRKWYIAFQGSDTPICARNQRDASSPELSAIDTRRPDVWVHPQLLPSQVPPSWHHRQCALFANGVRSSDLTTVPGKKSTNQRWRLASAGVAPEWPRRDSNPGPSDYESPALTAELQGLRVKRIAQIPRWARRGEDKKSRASTLCVAGLRGPVLCRSAGISHRRRR